MKLIDLVPNITVTDLQVTSLRDPKPLQDPTLTRPNRDKTRLEIHLNANERPSEEGEQCGAESQRRPLAGRL